MSANDSKQRVLGIVAAVVGAIAFGALMEFRSELPSVAGRAIIAGIAFGLLVGGIAWARAGRRG